MFVEKIEFEKKLFKRPKISMLLSIDQAELLRKELEYLIKEAEEHQSIHNIAIYNMPKCDDRECVDTGYIILMVSPHVQGEDIPTIIEGE